MKHYLSKSMGCYLWPILWIALGSFALFPAFALDMVSLTVNQIKAAGWSLGNVTLSVFDIDRKNPQFSLLSGRMALPSPLDDFIVADIQCRQFIWHENYLHCAQGQGRLLFKKTKTTRFHFSFLVQGQQGLIRIQRLNWLAGRIAIELREKSDFWRINIHGKRLNLAKLQRFLKIQTPDTLTGRADIEIELTGLKGTVQRLDITTVMKQLTLQAKAGGLASADLIVKSHMTLRQRKGVWQWRFQGTMPAGDLYIEPVYLGFDNRQTLVLTAEGQYWTGPKKVRINAATMKLPESVLLTGKADIVFKKGLMIQSARLAAHIPLLQQAAPIYLAPFLEAGPLEGILPTGKLDAKLTLQHNILTSFEADVDDASLSDPQQRFSLDHANAHIHWNDRLANHSPSFINWRQLTVKLIPLAAGRLDFVTTGKTVSLIKPVELTVLGGKLAIDQFKFAAIKANDAEVVFKGAVDNLSLSQLSRTLDWPKLDGEISGNIPAVHYHNKKLNLEGELKIQVFDGQLVIKKLASSGMFTDFAQFYSDIEFKNLDLNALTHTFAIGAIEGRLSGFVHNLYLENWRPVSFYAWLGTPAYDQSAHKISQRAVENIASIGGGGAVDILSRSFLRFFDTFNYDRLGIGCYLHQGVCQMMGIEPAPHGYYLIKGGGLPRIDIIGYNTRMDWNVLLQRLARITASGGSVVQESN